MDQVFKIGFSPCPNDIFIFEALMNKRIDLKGIAFEFYIEDVESLNERAFREELDITKLSYNAISFLTGSYQLLNSGSALGEGCGPLLIAKENISVDSLHDILIGIPGKYTTANFLLDFFAGKGLSKKEFVFSQIEDAVLSGEIGAGVIIHENRFTYEEKGLVKIQDLGEYWEKKKNLPIPLGGIAIRKEIPSADKMLIDVLIRSSLEFAFANPEICMPTVKKYSQEMDLEVMQKHIDLYVNKYSLNLGKKGKEAVTELFDETGRVSLEASEKIFIGS